VTLGRARPPRRFDCNAVRGPVGAGGARALSKRVVLRTEARAGQLAIDRLNLSGALQLRSQALTSTGAIRTRSGGSRSMGRVCAGASSSCPRSRAAAWPTVWPPKAPTCTSPAAELGWVDRPGDPQRTRRRRTLAPHPQQPGPVPGHRRQRPFLLDLGRRARQHALPGRADANGTHIDPRFLADSVYPMALAGAS
jgi:hypothetical protein